MVTPLHSPLETKLDKITTSPEDIDATSEIISITKRRKVWSAKTEYAADYPSRRRSWQYGEPREIERVIGGFGGELDGTIIVGNFQSVYQYDVEKDKWVNIDKNSCDKEPRCESAKGCKIGNCFMVYGEKAELLQYKPWLTKIYDSFPNGSRDDASSEEDNVQSGCNLLRNGENEAAESFLGPTHGLENFRDTLNRNMTVEQVDVVASVECLSSGNVKLKDTRPFWRRIADRISTFATPPETANYKRYTEQQRKPPRRFLRNQWFCHKPTGHNYKPIILRNHTLINIGYDKVLLSGDMGQMFMGQLTWDKLNVRWKRLENMPSRTRSRYLTFKMKDYVYAVGGYIYETRRAPYEEVRASLSCEKYNLRTKKWSVCRHTLPSQLNNASVVVAPDESYAVITGGIKERRKKFKPSNSIMVFEEETGFTLLEDQMLRRRSDHVSIVIR